MPSVTLPTTEDKNIVKKALPTSKILTSAVARLYIVLPHTGSWTYSQRWGAITFCKDKKKHNAFFIRLVDLKEHTGVIWEQELYEGFEYTKEKTFFHAFDTDNYLAGLEFVDEGEAEIFYKKVTYRDSPRLKDDTETNGDQQWKLPSRSSHIDKNTIGNPSDFRHVRHIGYTTNKGFTIENSNHDQDAIIEQLKALGITPKEIHQNQDFIHQFLSQRDANHAMAAKNTNSASPPLLPSSAVSPIPSFNKPGRRPPPPPPPPRKKTIPGNPPPFAPPRPSSTTVFPPIPQRGTRQPHHTTPTLHPSMDDVPPPPPPPPPMMTHVPLRSSPLPPANCPPAPPPAPPPPASNGAPDGRSNLMASIRATGGIGSLRKSTPTQHSSSSVPITAATAAAGATAASLATMQDGDSDNSNASGNLASSLAAVLKQRQTAMQSDDEDDDDDWE